MRPKHEDFTFHDHEQTAPRFALGDEREARHEERAWGEGAAREARARHPLLVWLHEGIQALLPTSRLL